jgi:hypothetical protein
VVRGRRLHGATLDSLLGGCIVICDQSDQPSNITGPQIEDHKEVPECFESAA